MLELGYPAIDDQLRKLVDLVNELHDALKAGHAQDVVGAVLGAC
jgi:hypothetical protein